MRPRATLAAAVCLLCACGRYSDFTLPTPAAGPEPHYRWEIRPGPVLPRGPAGAWDSVDVLNPSVIRFNGRMLNLYSGFDGRAWHTGVAESTDDGITWTRRGKVLSPDAGTWEGGYIAANGSALADGAGIFYWYQGGNPPRIGLARSSDGVAWRKEPAPVLDLGPTGSWDERGLGDPYVIRAGNRFYLFYTGLDRAGRQRLGIARSDDGLRWSKLRSNPVLEIGADRAFDENGLGEPAVWSAGGWWWMIYTGRDRKEQRRIGFAKSKDGVAWTRLDASTVFAGNEPWNSQVVCDPTVEVTPGAVRVWFGGGDVARPDERLNGAIGYAELRP